jgi:MFS family permease
MDERDIVFLAFMLPALIIVGGVVVMVWGIRHATRQAELEHQERMAMIERGITPSDTRPGEHRRRSHGFKMSLGILLCGLGMGLLMLITFAAGEPGTGFGIGGAIAMVGIAFIVSAMFTERQGPSQEDRMAARRAGMSGAHEGIAVPAFRDRAAGAPLVQRRSFDEPIPPPPADQP